ncbi:MAG TPA: glycosyltransferase [Gaiellaceae bacterium]|jgi:spore maturation protein CgeB|nr:glycosyltransferase [Gaiellaceae bacterium]
MNVAWFASSLVSSYWNGAATYYRGIVRALAERGHDITFYEPDAYDRQEHRDIDPPPWAEVVVWEPTEATARTLVRRAGGADLVVKASGVGVLDDVLEEAVAALDGPTRIFWDVDAPATLSAPDQRFAARISTFDLVLTYGGGSPVVDRYLELGARECVPVYNALDPETHRPAAPDARFAADLVFLGNRLPDREARVGEFFLRAAELASSCRFLLGGSGWSSRPLPENVSYLGHVGTADHNALNSTPLAVLNVTRDSMVSNGWSPPTRLFEAAGAGACLITDAWRGIEAFLEPGREVLVAETGADVANHLRRLTPGAAARIGAAALRRVLSEHTYAQRAEQVEDVLGVRA